MDLELILQSLGFANIDSAADWKSAAALLENSKYGLAFVDYDQNADIAPQLATQIKLRGAAIIFTSTILDRNEMPASLGEFKLFSKPYAANALTKLLNLKQR